MTTVYDVRLYLVYCKISRTSIEIGLFAQFFGKAIAEYRHLSLTEVTVSDKIYNFSDS